MEQMKGLGGVAMKIPRQDLLAKRLGGGLLGYAFMVSLALHLVVWGLLAIPRDDAGVSWAKGTLTRVVPAEKSTPYLQNVLAERDYAPAAVFLGSGDGASSAPEDAAVLSAVVDDARTDAGCLLVDPPDNTRNYAVRYARPPAAAAVERPPVYSSAPAPWPRPTPTAYIDEGGRVRDGAGVTRDALMAKTCRGAAAVEIRAGGREGEEGPAAALRYLIANFPGRPSGRPVMLFSERGVDYETPR